MILELPAPVKTVLDALDQAGFEAWLVGGCVLDALLGRTVGDYDLTTSATPEEMRVVFRRFRVLETGRKHGTLTVLLGGISIEITTYRVESGYSDHRRPDRVFYTRDLAQDLRRRDFTVNALAWRPDAGVTDLFGGLEDLRRRLIRCIGDPHERFFEDGLRLLRALRFAAVLEFQIEAETSRALRRDEGLLSPIARERCWQELRKLLVGPRAAEVLEAYPETIHAVVPQADVSAAHLEGFSRLPLDPVLRLGYLVQGAALPEEWNPLRLDHASAERITAMNRLAGTALPRERTALLCLLRREGVQAVHDLCSLQGDEACKALLTALEAQHACWTVRGLRISGEDLKSAGVTPGPEMGCLLNALLDQVIEGRCANEKAALLRAAQKWKGN